MEHEEHGGREEKEDRENREKVLVPVRRCETIREEEEVLEGPTDKVWTIPRRWHVYQKEVTKGSNYMETFVLAGKARTVFQLIELKAKLEAARKAELKRKTKKTQR